MRHKKGINYTTLCERSEQAQLASAASEGTK